MASCLVVLKWHRHPHVFERLYPHILIFGKTYPQQPGGNPSTGRVDFFRSGHSEWMLPALLKHTVRAMLTEAPASFHWFVIQEEFIWSEWSEWSLFF